MFQPDASLRLRGEVLDVYQVGTVLVPCREHTSGSLGLSSPWIRRFFIGDVAWTVATFRPGAREFWVWRQKLGRTAMRSGTEPSLDRCALMQAEAD